MGKLLRNCGLVSWSADGPAVRSDGTDIGLQLTDYYTTTALFMVATMTLILLFVGIHNAWDTVTYIVAGQGESTDDSAGSSSPSPPGEAP